MGLTLSWQLLNFLFSSPEMTIAFMKISSYAVLSIECPEPRQQPLLQYTNYFRIQCFPHVAVSGGAESLDSYNQKEERPLPISTLKRLL